MTRGVVFALTSAALFGASTPLAKLLIDDVDPALLAGLLYLGSGLGLTLVRLARPGVSAPMSRTDRGWLAGAIVLGGILGPLLLMRGLARTPASVAALLLNAEAVLTAVLAWVAFHENVDRRIAAGMLAIVAGALVLSWSGPTGIGPWDGPLSILGACLCWALDNNLTRKVALADPLQIARWKGLAAGLANTVLALAVGASLPSAATVGAAGVVGFFGYGISLVLFVLALRDLGTARAGAYFSAAPFVGALVAIILLAEPLTLRLGIAGALMGFGVWLHLTERHDHRHAHPAIAHNHAHDHDAHHDHAHEHEQGDGHGPHSHWHRHAPVTHRHPHYPDSHHRHPHG
jgi:drug/metabolite transporter (DMT)-like permease